MTRKATRRRVITPMPPRGLRPKLDASQVGDCGLLHIEHLDLVASGQATSDTLWDIARNVFTWSRAAELIGLGEPEMLEQLDLLYALIERYRRTGRVGFSGEQYQLAKKGVAVMDQLAEIVDRPSAVTATYWSEAQIARVLAENPPKMAA